MTNESYHADTSRISKSGVELMLRSPAHYWERYLNPEAPPRVETDAMRIGTMTHTAILEPEKFDGEYFVLDDTQKLADIGGKSPRSTSKYKYWKELQLLRNPRKIPIDSRLYEDLRRMQSAVHNHPAARALLSKGKAERTVLFNESTTGAPCKCRPDWLDSRNNLIVDIKTTENAGADDFGRSAVKYGYDIQSAFYLDGLMESGEDFVPTGFVFIAVEKSPPYGVAVYFAEGEIISLGRRKYMKGLELYMESKRTGVWPAYGDDIKALKLPAWAFR